jgi:hypothetical protein
MLLRQNCFIKTLREIANCKLQITGFEVYSSVLVIYKYQNNNKIKHSKYLNLI